MTKPWSERPKVHVLTVSTDDETYYTDVASMDPFAILRIRKLLDGFETSGGGELDLGDRELVLISNDMSEAELDKIAEALAEEAGEFSGIEVSRKLCLVTPWSGSDLLCKLPFRHAEVMHEFVEAGDNEVHGHEFPRDEMGPRPVDPEAARKELLSEPVVVAPGQEEIPW
jgi:hypothetical protein